MDKKSVKPPIQKEKEKEKKKTEDKQNLRCEDYGKTRLRNVQIDRLECGMTRSLSSEWTRRGAFALAKTVSDKKNPTVYLSDIRQSCEKNTPFKSDLGYIK